jgi:hypothetical protein
MSDINHRAQIEAKVTAADLERECPEVLQDLADRIAVHLDNARQCREKARQHRISAGLCLGQAQAACDDGGFKAFQERFFPKLGKSRVYELLQIATNRKTPEEIQAGTRERVAKHRAKKASDSVTVTECPDHVTERHEIPSDSVTVTESPNRVSAEEILEIEDPVEAGTTAQEERPEPEKPRRAHTPSDQALSGFNSLVAELRRRVGKFPVERFARTAIPADDLAKLGRFLTDLAQLKQSPAKPTLVAGAVGNGTISVEQSAERRKAQYKDLEEQEDMAA